MEILSLFDLYVGKYVLFYVFCFLVQIVDFILGCGKCILYIF